MSDRERLRKRCERALRDDHTDPDGNWFPYCIVEAQAVIEMLDAIERVEALRDEWAEGRREPVFETGNELAEQITAALDGAP